MEYTADKVKLYHGDCLEVLRGLPDESIDAVVTDPPYGLSNTTPAQVTECLKEWATGNTSFVPAKRGGFMGKDWDSFVPPPAVWAECFRVLKPGGHLLAFAGSRTQDLMGMSVRMAGFDIRDSFAWLYGSGFPKSMDVSKAIDKAAGAEREITGEVNGAGTSNTVSLGKFNPVYQETAPATPEAQKWEGWGTALKPAFEPVIMARKPFTGTVAANVLQHGTGAINIDAIRIGDGSGSRPRVGEASQEVRYTNSGGTNFAATPGVRGGSPSGRFPANVLLDESQAAALDDQSGYQKDGVHIGRNRNGEESSNEIYGSRKNDTRDVGYGGGVGASRFFYVAKAPKAERPKVDGVSHPTVKPLTLMRYLVRMVTPPGGTVLDPFAGSGTTLEAARLEGFSSVGVEAFEDYIPLIRHRLGGLDPVTDDLEDLLGPELDSDTLDLLGEL